MKLLLTSGGITNPSISRALVGMLGRPIAESSALCIPTAQWGHPGDEPVSAPDLLHGRSWGGTTSLGWKSLGVLELTALPTIGAEHWVPWVREADVLLVAGGEATYRATGCGSRAWPTSSRRWSTPSGWVSVRAAW